MLLPQSATIAKWCNKKCITVYFGLFNLSHMHKCIGLIIKCIKLCFDMTLILSTFAGNLTLYQTYVIRTAAFTKLGHGPFSSPLVFSMDPDNIVNMILANPGDTMEELTSQTWFIAFIGSVLFVLVLLFILVIIYRWVALLLWTLSNNKSKLIYSGE